MAVKKGQWKKIYFFKLPFSPGYFELFLRVPYVEFWEIYDKKEEKKNFFYMIQKTAKVSLVILSALVIYTVPTVIMEMLLPDAKENAPKNIIFVSYHAVGI
jgi:hypothetical protein